MAVKNFPKLRSHRVFLFGLIAIIGLNGLVLSQELRRISGARKIMRHQIIGDKFVGLDAFIRGQKYLSFYTDLNITQKKGQKVFSHAQFMLAPTVLDPAGFRHEYVLLVCSNEAVAWQKIRELNLMPLRKNEFGMILARRKDFHQ